MSGEDEAPPPEPGAVPRQSPIPKDEATSHDTEADAREARRSRARLRAPEPETEAPPSRETPEPGPSPEAKGDLPRARARLSAVRIHEAGFRRRYDEARARRDPRAPHPSQRAAPLVELSFARARDRGLRAYRVGQDGVRVMGVAHGEGHRGEPAELTVGLSDGSCFSVPVRAGEDAHAMATRLVARLASAFEVEMDRESEGSSFVRLVRPRARG